LIGTISRNFVGCFAYVSSACDSWNFENSRGGERVEIDEIAIGFDILNVLIILKGKI
jgi:hypothetical protein